MTKKIELIDVDEGNTLFFRGTTKEFEEIVEVGERLELGDLIDVNGVNKRIVEESAKNLGEENEVITYKFKKD